jgi:hypothetical protein
MKRTQKKLSLERSQKKSKELMPVIFGKNAARGLLAEYKLLGLTHSLES